MSIKKLAALSITGCTLLLSANLPAFCNEPKEEMVELMPATMVTKTDAALIEQNQTVLKSNQALIERVLTHLGVDFYVPKLPQYRALGANTILTLMDQVYYAAAAKKLGAPLPASYSEPSGSGVVNNSFLHGYNNEILRSISGKLDLPIPEKVAKDGSLVAYSHRVIVQNHEMLTAIATKLGVKP